MDLGTLTNATALVVSVVALLVSSLLASRQLRSARTSNDTVIAVDLLSRELMNERFQECEAYIVEKLSEEHRPDGGFTALPLSVRAQAYRVAWFYASLGHLVAFKAVDERLMLSLVNYRIRRAWFVLEPYIRAERAHRQSHFFQFFEHIACRAVEMNPSQLHRELGLRTFSAPLSRKRAFPGEGTFYAGPADSVRPPVPDDVGDARGTGT